MAFVLRVYDVLQNRVYEQLRLSWTGQSCWCVTIIFRRLENGSLFYIGSVYHDPLSALVKFYATLPHPRKRHNASLTPVQLTRRQVARAKR
ncbi:unnamed protein product [Fusarium venenatum]|uniref:Uncharacterized protein n=1 Tax=Fusarium venenatum TaxID=56646 RepID=A0A2L2STV2_9HYPO|nr:uncharacterized protein FVRRES_05220 [Fusarium venenatum]CEI60784.1 unnamed protein product [Fusarium venenatum]